VPEQLVTVARFAEPVKANLAKNCLEAEGIPAFLADEITVGMAWQLSNALGDIKLQVAEQDAERARMALAELPGADAGEPEEAVEGAEPQAAEADDEAEEPRSVREETADRAVLAALIGLLVIPLQLYVFWLLLKVFVSDEPLGPKHRRNAILAAVINLPIVAITCVFVHDILA
jgi:hypothetical protein